MATIRRPEGHQPMSNEQYAKLSPEEKTALAQAYHQSIRQAAEVSMVDVVRKALAVPREGDAVTTIEDLAVVLMHVEDPITPPQLREEWSKSGLEVGVMVSLREPFAKGLEMWRDPATQAASYAQAGGVIAQQPPPGSFYVACFALGLCSVVMANLSLVEEAPVSEGRASDDLGPPGDGIPELDDGSPDEDEDGVDYGDDATGDDAAAT